ERERKRERERQGVRDETEVKQQQQFRGEGETQGPNTLLGLRLDSGWQSVFKSHDDDNRHLGGFHVLSPGPQWIEEPTEANCPGKGSASDPIVTAMGGGTSPELTATFFRCCWQNVTMMTIGFHVLSPGPQWIEEPTEANCPGKGSASDPIVTAMGEEGMEPAATPTSCGRGHNQMAGGRGTSPLFPPRAQASLPQKLHIMPPLRGAGCGGGGGGGGGSSGGEFSPETPMTCYTSTVRDDGKQTEPFCNLSRISRKFRLLCFKQSSLHYYYSSPARRTNDIPFLARAPVDDIAGYRRPSSRAFFFLPPALTGYRVSPLPGQDNDRDKRLGYEPFPIAGRDFFSFIRLSNQVPEVPVVSPVSGCIFERRLIEKYLTEHGTDPINGEKLTTEMLIEVKTPSIVKGMPPSATSIPAILKTLQDEWDATMLQSFNVRQQLQTVRQELSHALYQQDAACRVIARLNKEATAAREALGTLKPQAAIQPLAPHGQTVPEPHVSAALNIVGQVPLGEETLKVLQETANMLTSQRKQRGKAAPAEVASLEDIQKFRNISSHTGLHSVSAPGILALDVHAADTSKLITGGNDKTAVVFNKDLEQVITVLKGHSREVSHVIYHPTEDTVLTASSDATIRVWHVPTSQTVSLIRAHNGPITGISLQATGDFVVSTSSDEYWAFSDIRSGGKVLTRGTCQVPFTSARFHPDGLIFATGAADSVVRIWELKERNNVANFTGHSGPITAISFSENGYYLATAATDSCIKLWDLRKLKNFKTINLDSNYEVKDLCFDQSGTYLGVAGSDVRVYHCKLWQELKVFNNHTADATGIRFGKDAGYIASVSMDRTLKTYDNEALLQELLIAVVGGNGISSVSSRKGKLRGHLVAFIKYCNHNAENPQRSPSSLSLIEHFRTTLLHESCEIRASGLRCIRYLMRTRLDAEKCILCRIPTFIARSLDIMLDNHGERIHAMRLIRRLLYLAPEIFPECLARSVIAIIQDGPQLNDWMFKAALAVACELGICNPVLLVQCGGITALTHSLVYCPSAAPAMGEAVLGVLLHILNGSDTRKLLCLSPDDLSLAVEEKLSLNEILTRRVVETLNLRDPLSLLHATMAPLTDVHYRHFFEGGNDASSVSDERDSNIQTCTQVMLSALRSWAGMISFFTNPDVEFVKTSAYSRQPPLKSIITVLGAKENQTKNAIVLCLFELFQIPIPEWTDDFLEALQSSDPSSAQDSWKLFEGFVAAEGNALIPLPATTRPRLAKNHTALLLSTFVSIGVLEGLVRVVLENKSLLSIRAVILLGELLHLSEVLLPPKVCLVERQSCLKQLIAVGTDTKSAPEERERALRSLSALARIHRLKKRPPRPHSVFLEQLMTFSNYNNVKVIGIKHQDAYPSVLQSQKSYVSIHSPSPARDQNSRKEREEGYATIVDETGVLLKSDEFTQWNWNALSAFLVSPNAKFKRYWEDPSSKALLNRLLAFFKPSSMQYCGMEVGHELARICTSPEGARLLEEFLLDVRAELAALVGEKMNKTSALSSSRVHNSMAQSYFLFLGRLTRSSRGTKIMSKLGILQMLLDLATQNTHDSHLKLIISSLDYTTSDVCRSILDSVLKNESETARLYATHFLELLARLETSDFHLWGTQMLINQLYDPASSISMAASRIIDKLCDNELYLNTVIDLKPAVLHFGERGLLMYIRFLSVPKGFYLLKENGFLNSELAKWKDGWNLRYVKILESSLHDAFSYYQRGEDGTYGRRTNDHHQVGACRLVPHLYGELARHQEGLDYLLDREGHVLTEYFELILKASKISSDTTCVDFIASDPLKLLELKAAIWAIGHLCFSECGVLYVIAKHFEVIPAMVQLAAYSPMFSVRGTCFYVLGLVGATPPGAALLAEYGWESVRIRSSESWPTRYWEETSTDSGLEYSFVNAGKLSSFAGFSGLWDELDSSSFEKLRSGTEGSSMDELMARAAQYGRSRSSNSFGENVWADTNALNRFNTVNSNAAKVTASKNDQELEVTGTNDDVSKQLSPTKLARNRAMTTPSNFGAELVNGDSDLASDSTSVQDSKFRKGKECARKLAPLVMLTPPSRIDSKHGKASSDSVLLEIDHLSPTSDRSTPDFFRINENEILPGDHDICDVNNGIKISDNEKPINVDGSGDNCAYVNAERFEPLPVRMRPKVIATPKSAGTEEKSMFRSLRYSRRPEIVSLPYELPLQGANYTGTRQSGGWPHFSIRRGRKSESDIGMDLCPNLSKAEIHGTLESPTSPTGTSPSFFRMISSRKSLFRRVSRRPSVDASVPSKSLQRSSELSLHGSNSRVEFADIPEIPSRAKLVSDARKAEDATDDRVDAGVQYVGVALPVSSSVLLSATSTRLNQKQLAVSQKDVEKRLFSIGEETISEEFAGTNFLDTGDMRQRSKTQASSFRLSGSSGASKWNDPDRDYDESESRTISERVLNGVLSICGHDENRCLVCHKIPEITEKYGSMPTFRSRLKNYIMIEEGDGSKEALVRKEILRIVGNMSSSVGLKTAERELLMLKQKYTALLKDPCLYSEVAALLGESCFRLQTRRFLQELFLDVDFTTFYIVPRLILGIGS
ncbi:unnamed protein product, partial [Notodromas monacha]